MALAADYANSAHVQMKSMEKAKKIFKVNNNWLCRRRDARVVRGHGQGDLRPQPRALHLRPRSRADLPAVPLCRHPVRRRRLLPRLLSLRGALCGQGARRRPAARVLLHALVLQAHARRTPRARRPRGGGPRLPQEPAGAPPRAIFLFLFFQSGKKKPPKPPVRLPSPGGAARRCFWTTTSTTCAPTRAS